MQRTEMVVACLGLLIACPSLVSASCYTCRSTTNVRHEWDSHLNAEFSIPVTTRISGGWTVELQFSKPVAELQIWRAKVQSTSSDSTLYILRNMPWNQNLSPGTDLEMSFIARFDGPSPSFSVRLLGQADCGPSCLTSPYETTLKTTVPPISSTPPSEPSMSPLSEPSLAPSSDPMAPTTETPTTSATAATTQSQPSSAPYNYADVIHKSILFYEAQRSGDLPDNNRIPWRFDSTLNDTGDNGEDLTGGWFDAGDYVKFGFPMASSVTVLAWGLVEYRDAYNASGELNYMLDCIKWATDYFLKCHTAKYEFYGQVGDGNLDHSYWGRPEDMTISRPAFKITAANPGSELAGETAAALAAAHMAFRQTDPQYAGELLSNAIELYDFANQYQGTYTDAIPNAANFYGSHNGYGDELAWSAAWLARATGDEMYLSNATAHYDAFVGDGIPWAFSWDDKKAGVMLLMYQLTGSRRYKTAIINFLNSWQPGNIPYTPKGLAWRSKWGTNRYAANTAFLALVAADEGIKAAKHRKFAKRQINYMLGDGGRSYVVGFGNNPPHSPHHRASSCPDKPAVCDFNNLNDNNPNPQVLEGALVGGPDLNDGFQDNRRDYIQNEVACDYNAGFQSAVAGLKSLDIRGLY